MTNFTDAVKQICEEKNISQEVVIETIEAALAAAYKKDYGSKDQEVRVELNSDTGEVVVYVQKEVVDEVENPMTEISVVNANMFKKDSKVGDTIEIKDLPSDFGRIAAQTAKQVIRILPSLSQQPGGHSLAALDPWFCVPAFRRVCPY